VATLRDFPTRSNSLNAIRLLLAVLVIVSHSWPIGGFGDAPRWNGVSLGKCAVFGFFAISGWLITRSRLTSPLRSFGVRRFLRIYPGFVVALLVVAFAVAPLGSALGGGPYSVGDGVRHVVANATMDMRQFAVGATPVGVPYPAVWNGSLWTLYYEAACYVSVGLLLTVVGRRWFGPVVVGAWIGLTVLAVGQSAGWLEFSGFAGNFLELAPYFFAGATLFVLCARVPLHWLPAGLAVAWTAAVPLLGADPVLAALPIAYLMLWLGAVLPLTSVGRRNDISYGMYIYAFPVQQLLVLLGVTHWGLVPYVATSVVATVPLAVLSWYLVERPAQRLGRPARPADGRIRLRTGAAAPVTDAA
jgi:peptidoglycan/LPS O-acetylase OafA/YrhL